MRKIISIILIGLAMSVSLWAEKKQATVITYPAPKSEKVNSLYTVSVNGQKLDVYKALSPQYLGGEYYFCYFDFEGEVEVKVKSRNGFHKLVSYTVTDKDKRKQAGQTLVGEVYPRHINSKVGLKEVLINADKPFQAIVIRNERSMPLVIFGNPIEKDIPKKDDPNVIFFDKGVHYLDKPLRVGDNKTVYIAGGAVVKGGIFAKGKNITIRGRGILSADNFSRGRIRFAMFDKCENLKVEGIIFKDPVSWTFTLFQCNKVDIDNIKICASRMINDDAIDICNSQNVTIKNTFARAQDDIIAIKGMKWAKPIFLPIENIYIENCIFWTDAANVFRIGYECDAQYFKNIKCKDIYVPYYASYRKPNEYWSHAIVWLQPTNDMPIENVEIDGLHIRSNGGDMPLLIAQPRIVHCAKTYGNAKGCTIKNVVVDGKKGKFRGEVFIDGRDDVHSIKDITIENAVYFGKKLTPSYKHIFVGKHTENINLFLK